MPNIQLSPQVLLALAILVAALAIGALGTVLGGAAKTRLWYWSHSLIGVSIVVFGIAALLWNYGTPMLEATVIIEKVGIQTTGRGSERTNLVVRLASGETTTLAASGRNEFFRPGQRMLTRYQEFTGTIDWARFLSPSGSVQAEYRSHTWISPWVLLGLGLVQIASARRRFLRGRNSSVAQTEG